MPQNEPTYTYYEEVCPVCDGGGTAVSRHPQWGQLSCPEDYVEVDCSECRGYGVFIYAVEEENDNG